MISWLLWGIIPIGIMLGLYLLPLAMGGFWSTKEDNNKEEE